MSRASAVLAVDLGGTNMRAALVGAAGTVLARASAPTRAPEGPDAALERFLRLLRRLLRSAPDVEPLAIGLALASPMDPASGRLSHPPSLPGWHGSSPQELLGRRLGLPAWSHNDASLAALGEYAYGIGKGTRHLVMLTWGTGVGGGIVLDGQIYSGHQGFAGEFGHLVVDPWGPACPCGARGCLEALASGTAIARQARERLQGGEPSLLRRMVRGNLTRIRSETVARAEQRGDPLAHAVLQDAAAAMGVAVAALRHVFDPDLVVIGGGVSSMLHALYPALVRAANAHAMASTRDAFPVVPTVLGDDAGLLGAAVLGWQGLGGWA